MLETKTFHNRSAEISSTFELEGATDSILTIARGAIRVHLVVERHDDIDTDDQDTTVDCTEIKDQIRHALYWTQLGFQNVKLAPWGLDLIPLSTDVHSDVLEQIPHCELRRIDLHIVIRDPRKLDEILRRFITREWCRGRHCYVFNTAYREMTHEAIKRAELIQSSIARVMSRQYGENVDILSTLRKIATRSPCPNIKLSPWTERRLISAHELDDSDDIMPLSDMTNMSFSSNVSSDMMMSEVESVDYDKDLLSDI